MNLSKIKAGDKVIVKKNDREFEAKVVRRMKKDEPGNEFLGFDLLFEPEVGNCSYRMAFANEVLRRTDPPPGKQRKKRRKAKKNARRND